MGSTKTSGKKAQNAPVETTQAKALRLLGVIYDQTQGDNPPVIVTDTDTASIAGLSIDEARTAWTYLADKSLIKTFNLRYSAKINARGMDAIEGLAQAQPQQVHSVTNNTINIQTVTDSVIQQSGAGAVMFGNKKGES